MKLKLIPLVMVFSLCFNFFGYYFSSENDAGLDWEDDIITVAHAEGDSYVAYPRMYTLSDNSVICGYERDGDMYCKISADDGLTWDEEIHIAHADGLTVTNAAFIQLDGGELLCAYRVNGMQGEQFYSSIRVSSSMDNGKTWEYHSLVISRLQDSDNFNGVWEPHFGLIDGVLTVFYANDSLTDGVSSGEYQNIEFMQWNGSEWINRTVACDGEEDNSRDGMPVWCRLSDGSYVMVIESTHLRDSIFRKRSFVLQIYTSSDGVNWEKGKDIYISKSRRTSEYAGAPYVVELPDGRLCISFQTDENSLTGTKDNWTARVITTKDPYTKGLNRYSFTKPFAPFGEDGKSAWNGMLVHNSYLFVFTTKTDETGSSIQLRRALL